MIAAGAIGTGLGAAGLLGEGALAAGAAEGAGGTGLTSGGGATGLGTGSGYAGIGLNPAIQTGDELAYSGLGMNPAITGSTGVGLNATIPGITSGLATNAGALGAAFGIPITAAEFAGAGGLTAEQAAALDSALTAAGAGGAALTASQLASLLGPASKLLSTGSSLVNSAKNNSGNTNPQKLLNPYMYGGSNTVNIGRPQNITADLTRGNTNFSLNDFGNASATPQLFNTGTNPAAYAPIQSYQAGGTVEDHNPTFFSPGGLASMENTYVKGEGDGTSDSVAAMLANGEFVIPADVVSKLGNGSNDAGANVLDEFLSTSREQAQKHNPKELPPDSKGPLAYLAEANKKVKA
jgi:hypothetical protein